MLTLSMEMCEEGEEAPEESDKVIMKMWRKKDFQVDFRESWNDACSRLNAAC